MIAFRQIRADDPAAFARVDHPLPGIEHLLVSEEWKPAGTRTAWVACSDSVPIAVASACRRSGELLGLSVQPEFRSKRIGRELLRQTEAWLFSHGWGTISAACDPASGMPVDFLIGRGWRMDEANGGSRLFKDNPGPRFALEEHWIEDAATGYGRLVRLSRGHATRAHPLCLVLDGESYWRDMAAVPVFEDITASLPSGMTVAYVGHVSALDRHQDFTANDAYARFIGEAVIPWLRREVAGLSQGGHMTVGLSLSGLMAVHLTLRYPEHFRSCISQSGSHWWDPEGFEEAVKRHSPLPARFWLSVGSKETATDLHHAPTGLHQKISQIEGVQHAAKVLDEHGAKVRYQEFDGGHSMEFWREELGDALRWALG